MTIDRSRLLEVLAAMPFRDGRWVVAGSGPLLAMGVIDTISDVDIVADARAWHSVAPMAETSAEPGLLGDSKLSLVVGGVDVEVFDGWLGIDAETIIAEAVELDGHFFVPIERVIESKRRLDRPKDRLHLLEIARYRAS